MGITTATSWTRCVSARTRISIPRLPQALRRGLEYYRRELILADGTPKYFSTSAQPLDTQSAAQAIQTFAIASSDDPSYLDVAWRVFEWSLRNLRREDGLFIFQRRRLWTNRVPHMRWVVGSMLLALTHLRNAVATPVRVG